MSETTGISFTGLLFLLFLGLKLAGVISWPWIWVCAPIWIPVLIGLVIILIMLVYAWFEDRA